MSGSESIHSESEISEDESAYNSSDENFIDDWESEISEEEYVPPKRKTKKIEINIKTEK